LIFYLLQNIIFYTQPILYWSIQICIYTDTNNAWIKKQNFIPIMYQDTTIYYISFYRVAGARMMYRYLPKSVGLRRITLHKSMSQGDKMYLLICECSQLQDNLSAAAILLPALRARLCGYTGLYRPSVCFWFLTRLLESARNILSIALRITLQKNPNEMVSYQISIFYFTILFVTKQVDYRYLSANSKTISISNGIDQHLYFWSELILILQEYN